MIFDAPRMTARLVADWGLLRLDPLSIANLCVFIWVHNARG